MRCPGDDTWVTKQEPTPGGCQKCGAGRSCRYPEPLPYVSTKPRNWWHLFSWLDLRECLIMDRHAPGGRRYFRRFSFQGRWQTSRTPSHTVQRTVGAWGVRGRCAAVVFFAAFRLVPSEKLRFFLLLRNRACLEAMHIEAR